MGRVGPDLTHPPAALYVHVPFCRSLCPYCDFVVVAGAAAVGPRSRVAAFMAALLRELDLRAAVLDASHGSPGGPRRPALATLYFGGGTPSLLPAEAVAELVERVRDRYGLADGAEVTLEANPGPDDRGDLPGFARAGVTRLSLGAQSLDDAELRSLGRRHRAGDVAEAVLAARAAGIGQVSLDLLYDVPNQRLATWMGTVEGALEMGPDHVSCYALTLDDPDVEGLTGPLGDHLPTTAGRPPLARAGALGPGRGPGRRRVFAGRRRIRRRRDAVVRAVELGASGSREPPQPVLLGTAALRGGRPGRPRLRRRAAAMERRPLGRVDGGAHARAGRSGRAPARRWGGDRRRDRRRRGAHPRAADGAWRPPQPRHDPGGRDGLGPRGGPAWRTRRASACGSRSAVASSPTRCSRG